MKDELQKDFARIEAIMLPLVVFGEFVESHNVILNRQKRIAKELKTIGAKSITMTVQEPTPVDRWIYKNSTK